MAENAKIYKCNLCGNVVEILSSGGGTLVCCGQTMEAVSIKTSADEKKEKHVPVVEMGNGEITVKVGSVEHPMEAAHYIQWIEVIFDCCVQRAFLKPGDKPQATFKVCGKFIEAREYCNQHGYWTSK